jgi:general secretion pathway protein L
MGVTSPQALCVYGKGLTRPELETVAQDFQLTLVTPATFALQGLPQEQELETTVLPALGAALRGLGKVPLGANLLPEAEQGAVSLGGFSLTKLLLAVFLALSLLYAGSALVHKRVLLYQVNGEVARLAPEALKVEKQLEESRALSKQLQTFRRRLDQSPNKLVILKDLTQLIPDHTWLFQMRLSQQNLEMGGMSKSAADLIPLLEKSGWLTKTEFASPIVTDASKLEHFKIKAEVKGLELGS